MVLGGVCDLCIRLKVRRIHPLPIIKRIVIYHKSERTNLDLELPGTPEGRMFEGLDNRHVGILHVSVLAHEGY